MKLETLRSGLALARRHRGVVVIFWLTALVPALLVLSLIAADMGSVFERSLEAERILHGEWFPVWIDFTASEQSQTSIVGTVLPSRILLMLLIHVLVAAGAVEVLLERSEPADRPFFTGMGLHGWRFIRSFLWFALALLPVVLVVGAIRWSGSKLAEWTQNGWWGLGAVALSAIVGFLLYAVVDLAYDLSRIASATHRDQRMGRGFRKALRAVLHRPKAVLYAYLPLALALILLPPLFVLLRGQWLVNGAFEVVLLLVIQQAMFLLQAYFKTALWGAEIVTFRAWDAPRWCAKERDLRPEPEPGRWQMPASDEPPHHGDPLEKTWVDVPSPVRGTEG